MRRRLPLILLIVLLSSALLTGCAPEKKEPLLGICLPPAAPGWAGSLLPHARMAADEWGGPYTVAVAPEVPGGLLTAVEELIAQQVTLVVMYAYDADEGAAAIAALDEQAIPYLLVGTPVKEAEYAALVAADHYAIGKAAGMYLADRLSGTGSVLVLEGAPGEVTRLRNQGFQDALASYPGIEVMAGVNCGGHRDIAKTEVMIQMENNPGFSAIFAHSDEMAAGAIESLEAIYANVQAVVSIGGSQDAIDSLLKNHRYWKMTWATPPSIAADAVRLATAYIDGEPLPENKEILSPPDPIDPTNALARYDENALY